MEPLEDDPAAPVTLADYFVIVGIDADSYDRLTRRSESFGPRKPSSS